AFAPKAHRAAIVDDWSGYYIKRVKEVMDGSWKSGDVWGGIKDGFVKLAPFNDAVTPAARAAADEVTKGIVAGTVKHKKKKLTLSDADAAAMAESGTNPMAAAIA
ncbi:MAG: BMP family ABC transporter substrate-binding protein, partial [Reyranella sp.]|nr:BMP family ABC transporter substrate-binding protein [Reyranella sp.]